MKFLAKLNGLITRAEAKLIDRAAQLLVSGDGHDAYFFTCLKKYATSQSDYSIPLDSQGTYVVLKTAVPATKETATFKEVNSNG